MANIWFRTTWIFVSQSYRTTNNGVQRRCDTVLVYILPSGLFAVRTEQHRTRTPAEPGPRPTADNLIADEDRTPRRRGPGLFMSIPDAEKCVPPRRRGSRMTTGRPIRLWAPLSRGYEQKDRHLLTPFECRSSLGTVTSAPAGVSHRPDNIQFDRHASNAGPDRPSDVALAMTFGSKGNGCLLRHPGSSPG